MQVRSKKALVAWLATPLVAIGCAADGVEEDAQEPATSETTEALTSTIPTSAECNQGVGASKCVQAPPFEVTSTANWTVDGVKGAKEYAGSVVLPFMTDGAYPAGIAGGSGKLQANGRVYLQRVTLKGTLPLLVPRNVMYAYFEDVYVWSDGNGNPFAGLNVYLDNNRFDGPDANAHAEDRRYRVNLASGSAVTVEQPSGVGSATTWGVAPLVIGLQYAAGGCVNTSTPRVMKCSGEMKIPLHSSAWTEPAAGLAPGVGFMARTTGVVGMSPDLPVTSYATADWNVKAWQTVLFTRPRGIDLSVMTWNVRRFESLFESSTFGTVSAKDIGVFLAKHDIVAIQEGWDRGQVKMIVDEANIVRVGAGLPKYNLYGPIDHEPAMSEVTQSIVDGFTDTQGGLWIMSHLPLASHGYHVYTPDSCRGEDCWKAKGVQWARLYLQDPGAWDPKKCRPEDANCNKQPSGDDFIDVFNTHLQADDPMLCKGESDWAGIKAAALAILASFVDPVLAFHAAILIELVEADLNCGSLTDRGARAKQLAQMNTFVSQVAAKDRSSLLLGDFNIDGKLIAGSEYKDALVALKIAPSSAPSDDTVSALPPGGFDIRHGDVVRERTDVDFSTGICIGTSIGETGGAQEPSCTFAGGTDADTRLDYILVRPPQLVANWQGYPRWFISAVPGQQVWASPFPSLSGAFSATPLRLSDHKPVSAALSFSRLSNPPKYNAGWKHTVEQRVVSVDATGVDDCLGCDEVDPFARLESRIDGASLSFIDPTTECSDNQSVTFGSDGCMANWFRKRNHTPPSETTVALFAKVWDHDSTSGNDLIHEGTTSEWNYLNATFGMSFKLFGSTFALPTWQNPEAVPMSRCGGVVDVCHSISVTEIAP